MSRRAKLQSQFSQPEEPWITDMFISNIPDCMTDNEFIMSTSIVVNSLLYTLLNDGLENLQCYQITKNR